MKIAVLIKETPDTETKIILKPSKDQTSTIDTSGFKWIVNPYDDFAVEEALKIKDKDPSTEVVVVCFGPQAAKERMIKSLAMGADRGVLIDHEGVETTDSLLIAKVLAKALKEVAPDMVLCGKQAIDDDNMHIPAMVASLLEWPHVNVVTSLTHLQDKLYRVEREVEGGQVECYEVRLPAVFGAHKSLNNPRYVALPGIMKAKKKPLDVKTIKDLGFAPTFLADDRGVSIEDYKMPPAKAQGKIFKDAPLEQMVDDLVRVLREEAKVI